VSARPAGYAIVIPTATRTARLRWARPRPAEPWLVAPGGGLDSTYWWGHRVATQRTCPAGVLPLAPFLSPREPIGVQARGRKAAGGAPPPNAFESVPVGFTGAPSTTAAPFDAGALTRIGSCTRAGIDSCVRR